MRIDLPGPSLPCENPKALFIMLHGYGADGYNILPAASALNLPNTYIWAPHGHEVCEQHAGGRQWFSLRHFDASFLSNPIFYQAIDRAASQLREMLHTFTASLKIPILLGGFSQGAALAYHLGLQEVSSIGVLGFSGFYALYKQPKFTPPLFWSHGAKDQVVPLDWAKMAYTQLLNHHLSVQMHIVPHEGHTTCQNAILSARSFVEKILPL